jgi:hypothetical protein
MPGRPMRIKLTLAACLVGVLAFSSVSVAQAPAPSKSGHFAPYPGRAVTPLAESGDITAGSCTYRQAVDNAHISSTAPRAVSVHGWWIHRAGTCPSTANVDTYLQGYWCDQFGCRWITVGYDSGDVRAGGGSGNRITARHQCSSASKTVGFRGYVDVDLNGVSDPSGYTYSPPQNLTCVP